MIFGVSKSGKSTLFKQIKRIQRGEIEMAEKEESKHVIRMNLVEGMLVLLQQAHKLFEQDKIKNKDCQIKMENLETLTAIQEIVEYNSVVSQEHDGIRNGTDYEKDEESAMIRLGEHLALLWENEGVQATYNKRDGIFSFPDNLDYFFDKVECIMAPDYIPDDEDVIKVRMRTTGMIIYEYEIDPKSAEILIQIVDVGGARNERKKWIHQFSGIHSIIYVAALNHYVSVK